MSELEIDEHFDAIRPARAAVMSKRSSRTRSTLTLKEGEIMMSVLGPSGCGKDHAFEHRGGVSCADVEGRGHPGRTTRVTGPGPRTRYGLSEGGALFEWMNVRENVDFGPSHERHGQKCEVATRLSDHLLDVDGPCSDFKEKGGL